MKSNYFNKNWYLILAVIVLVVGFFYKKEKILDTSTPTFITYWISAIAILGYLVKAFLNRNK